MIYSPKAVANFFIDIAKRAGEPLSPMKLQKLVYYAHGWYAGFTGSPLIDESVEAWQYGPVIPSLYHEFKKFGSGQITSKATQFTKDFELQEVPAPSEEDIRKFLTSVWNSYGKYTGLTLSQMTHAADSPWDITWKKAGNIRSVDIPFSEIEAHFNQAVRNSTQAAQK
ncbi:Panacea domain-containing protein [Variovorax sp. V116]|uniref:Panacea domain-containing protein n=1 Tax=Variovorax sp. V116 TaxID=3065953 RepID=UPI0034E8D19E